MNHESIDENGINENAIAAGEAKRDDWAVGTWNIPTMPHPFICFDCVAMVLG